MQMTKCCTKCHRSLPVEEFRMRTHKIRPYLDSRCKACHAALKRDVRARQKAGAYEPKVRVVHVFGRHPEDVVCDAAFMGWRCAGVAFQGARL